MANSPKRILLTANGDEISAGIVRNLAKCGCRLVIMGDENNLRSLVREITSSLKESDQIELIGLNMEEESEAVFDSAVDKAWKLLDSVDAFVNCYLYEGKIQDPLDVSESEYKKIVQVNVMAPWFLLQAVAKRMRDAGSGGSIVYLSTVLGAERGMYRGAAAFGSCMGAIKQLVRVAALELGKHSIRVNGIARGLHLDDGYPVSVGRERAEKMTADVMPLGRWLDPQKDLASTVLYLISDDSRYMTGTTIFVDGAQSMVRARMRSFI
ncbi:L-xylulose reductase-like [Phalaenopsis equestris]|uniref:L-xylulose reductase-like n=1 Tax=Phalaenopsis equestris TaxID=78828 RepID=UPI0009E3FAD7|nr:L-xylulose reductase-like [Phalaenopsis equestris]XP_020581140.1 L-xylulose reductase-like [Phalaenopsis equestris]